MNWVDFWVSFFVAIALVAVIIYRLYPLFSKKKRLSRKAKEMVHDYYANKRKEEKKQNDKN